MRSSLRPEYTTIESAVPVALVVASSPQATAAKARVTASTSGFREVRIRTP
jgi:hypothetical protein